MYYFQLGRGTSGEKVKNISYLGNPGFKSESAVNSNLELNCGSLSFSNHLSVIGISNRCCLSSKVAPALSFH